MAKVENALVDMHLKTYFANVENCMGKEILLESGGFKIHECLDSFQAKGEFECFPVCSISSSSYLCHS